MKTPFTTEQFFKVFEHYNSTVFPFQLVIILLGFTVLFLLHSKIPFKNKLIGGYLGVLWIWIGLVYHLIYFTEINKAAYVFGGIFILQGFLILLNTLVRDKLVFTFNRQLKDYAGYFFILFGLIIYPVIGYLVEGSFIRTIVLGLPCPSTIFTFGFLMLTDNKFPKYLLIIPSLWAIVGLSAAFNFGVYQDFMLIISAIISDYLLIRKRKVNY